MVDVLSAIAGNSYNGYDVPVKAQNNASAGRTDRSGSTKSLPAVYDPYDLDGDGELSYSEYLAYLKAMGFLSFSSLSTIETNGSRIVFPDMALAAYQANAAGSQAGSSSSETQGNVAYTPISIIV